MVQYHEIETGIDIALKMCLPIIAVAGAVVLFSGPPYFVFAGIASVGMTLALITFLLTFPTEEE